MKHPTQEQLLNAAVKLDDAYPAVAAMLVRMAEQAAEPVNFVVSAVLVKDTHAGINTQNRLYPLFAVSRDEAHGKVLSLLESDFPEHRLHTICSYELPAPTQQAAEPVAVPDMHPTNSYLFKEFCKRVGIELGKDNISAALSKLYACTAPTQQPLTWQPIETAPTDGTPVLLATRTGRMADGKWHQRYGVWGWPYVMTEPTHWMPRPDMPNPHSITGSKKGGAA